MSTVPVVSLSVAFGVAAGFVGGLLAVNHFYPAVVSESATLFSGHEPFSVGDGPVRVSASVEAAARAQVLFYQVGGTGSGNGIFLPSKAMAAGVVLTSDGWLVSHGQWPEGKRAGSVLAVIGLRPYPVDRIVTDPASGTVFAKIEAVNLPVIGFGNSSVFDPGDSVFAYDAVRGPRRLDVVGYGPDPASGIDGLIVSSDRSDRRLRLTAAEGILPGTMVLDRQGQVTAIFVANDLFGSSAVPFGSFSGQVEPVVRNQSPYRPMLGVNYIDLSRLAGTPDRFGDYRKGALLVTASDGKRVAVIADGPAGKVGLRAGDLVLAVNGEDVSAKRSLSDIVGDYRPGDRLTLRVLRGAFSGQGEWRKLDHAGVETEITVELGQLP